MGIIGPPITDEHREAAQRADTMTSSQIVPAEAKNRVRELREEAQIVARSVPERTLAQMSTQAEHREDAQNAIHPKAASLAVPVCTTYLPMLLDNAMVIQQIRHGHFRTTTDYLGSNTVGITRRLSKRMGHPHAPIDGKETIMPWGAEFYGVLEPEHINDTKWSKMIRLGEPPVDHDKFRPRIAAATRRMLTQHPESPKQKAQMVQLPVKPKPEVFTMSSRMSGAQPVMVPAHPVMVPVQPPPPTDTAPGVVDTAFMVAGAGVGSVRGGIAGGELGQELGGDLGAVAATPAGSLIGTALGKSRCSRGHRRQEPLPALPNDAGSKPAGGTNESTDSSPSTGS